MLPQAGRGVFFNLHRFTCFQLSQLRGASAELPVLSREPGLPLSAQSDQPTNP